MPTKRELKLIAFSAVFLLFIVGCGGGEVATGAPTTPFLGGAGGLEIGFLEGSPPAEVTDGNTFPFNAIISLKNAGEQDVKKDEIKLSLIGFLPSQFGISSTDEAKLKDQTLLEDLSGRKRDADGNIIEPVEVFFTFPDKNDQTKNFNFNGQLAGNNIFVFRADACYKYQTRVKSDVCVLQNQIDPAADAICKPSEAKAVFSSGSPIKVSSFRQNVAGSSKLQLSFDVEHSGSGDVFSILVATPTAITDAIKDLDTAIGKTVSPNEDAPGAILSANAAKGKILEVKLILSDTDKVKADSAVASINFAVGKLGETPPAYSTAKPNLEAAKTMLQSITTKVPIAYCPKDSAGRRANEDMVSINVSTGLPSGTNNYKLSCVGLASVEDATIAEQIGKVKLINGKRTITCTLDLPTTRTDFVKPIEITVDFNYAQSADTEVLVKHILANP